MWRFHKGKISRPEKIGDGGIYYLPQTVYLVKGTLIDQIIYPHNKEECKWSDNELRDLLESVNLKYFIERYGIHSSLKWNKILSVGEIQRLGFARVIYHQPTFAVLDESDNFFFFISDFILISNRYECS